MLLDKLNIILRITILISMIILFILLLNYKTHHCDFCRFEWDGRNINANEFTGIYFLECLSEPDMNISLVKFQSSSESINISLNSESLN